MIKYVELTAPEASAFRQAKILSIECQEGDQIKEGDTLFRVQSGAHEINLPATQAGKIVELIATLQESITLSTALLLLETEVESSTASQPIEVNDDDTQSETVNENESHNSEPSKSKIDDVQTSPQPDTKQNPLMPEEERNADKKSKKVVKKKHEQQSLDLMAGDLFESNDSKEQQNVDDSEVVLTQVVTPVNADINNHSQPSLTMPSSSIIEVTVPDIGADSAKVIEILVNIGDSVSPEDPLITLESDKASMDVPSPSEGVVKEISVSVDQDVSEGTLILLLEAQIDSKQEGSELEPSAKAQEPAQAPAIEESSKPAPSSDQPSKESIVEVTIPDIGGDSAKVIEILVNIGDSVEVEDALVTLESDKASMDVPSSANGVIQSIDVSIDQDVSEGTVVVTLLSESGDTIVEAPDTEAAAPSTNTESSSSANTTNQQPSVAPTTSAQTSSTAVNQSKSHASPSIRRFARELGVDLGNVSGSGRKGRVTHDDVKSFVKNALSKPSASPQASASGTGIPQVPAQDFSKFGDIDIQPLNKIKRLTAENLHRSWLNVPHVTHNDESNISDLEEFRKRLNSEYEKQKRDIKLSPLAFIVKAVVNGLQEYPQFNSSIEPGGENLIYKKYFNIGIAVETPNGLVVPVVKDADKKSVAEIAKEMSELAKKARDKKLTMNDMSGACITISSLGGIGGTGFTPIVNTPEVAILGVSRSKMQPVWNGSEFKPGMILPLSLSYDHRVIDGAEAARFTRHIAAALEDIRRLTV